ncbi:MAG: tRNA lysidine(34) synthetase TilS [Chloroflexi bacterium]|nr:tRNA lysidine(34) synthetase TilS [Chloroflexota bacterium]
MTRQDNRAVRVVRRRIRQELETAHLTGQKLVVAVSGGPDSLTLLYALHALREELILTLHGAHLDHGLRGEASEKDARFVANTFADLGMESTIERSDVAGYREMNRLSAEGAAREVRYAFLARVARQQNAAAIALGHTSDDQAESVLMHLLRGTGLTGLQGMRTLSRRGAGEEQVVLVRPLLGVSRKETEAYCAARNLEPRHDETNDVPDMTRNRVRAELLPVLESYNPAVRRGLVRLARNASLDVDYFKQQVDAVWSEVCTTEAGGISIDLGSFRELHPALQRHLLRKAVLCVKGNLEDLEQIHVEDMARLASGSAGKSLDLPGGLKFAVGYREAVIRRREAGTAPAQALALEACHEVRVPGEIFMPGWEVRASLQFQGDVPPASGPVALLSAAALAGRVWVRTRRPGDRFQPLGMAHRKKLQDFMVDSKIPRDQRDGVPLLVTPRGIAWVVGWRVAEWARAGDEPTDRILVEFSPKG